MGIKLLLTKGSDLNQQQNVEMIALFHAYFFCRRLSLRFKEMTISSKLSLTQI